MKKLLIIVGVVGLVLTSVLGRGVVRAEGDIGGSEPSLADERVVPELYISAINPGYNVDGVNNVGEMIEIGSVGASEEKPFLLAGITVSYTNSSGNIATLLEFPEYSLMTGEKILLRLASSPGSELAALNYTKTLAFKGGISLMRGEEVLDAACWSGAEGCMGVFKSASPTTLVRNLESGEFEHVSEYEPLYDVGAYKVDAPPNEVAVATSQCRGMVFSEVLSYYESTQAEQFVEVHNVTAEQIRLDGCVLRYKGKTHELTGLVPGMGTWRGI